LIAPILGNCTMVSKDTYKVTGNGIADQIYSFYSAIDISLPINLWTMIDTTKADTNGVIQFIDQSTNNQRFYRFGRKYGIMSELM
ncbi:MAG: hypothetical protein JWQ71_4263, partial [Pedosphaera sp.]|nr:hypothetical protein [Pedosphaera sp.]